MDHPVVVLGVLLSSAALLSVLFRVVKQSSIIAFIAVGLIAGLFHDVIHIPHETTEIFTEIGIILLLFMAGLEMDFASLRKRWRVVIGNGLGQISFNAILAAGLGLVFLGITGASQVIFFALCLTFSSTIIVLGTLKKRRELESYHGQIILGIMVLQDIVAVISLAVLKGLGAEGSVGAAIGLIFVKLLILIAVLTVLARWVLPAVFRHLAETQELLFIGSLGWAMGVAAACDAANFSPEIGAFMAGAALSFLPYRLEIQDKVEPMKDFGVILFFLALGYGLKIDASVLDLLPKIAIVTAFVVVGTPILMTAIGFVARSKSRPAFFIGAIINQISEFSLILALLCHDAGIFEDRTFMLVTLSTVATMFLSSFGHQSLERIYQAVYRALEFLDRRASVAPPPPAELENHVVVIAHNELAEIFIEHSLAVGKKVLLIDIDPDIYSEHVYRHENLLCYYADIFDPDVREEASFAHAAAIVSCMNDGQEAELGILYWLKNHGLQIPFVAATASRREARELYEAGATFVIQTEEMAAEQIGLLLDQYGEKLEDLEKPATRYREKLRGEVSASTNRTLTEDQPANLDA
jgi:Kef-type K+ transport system membrane component KefB